MIVLAVLVTKFIKKLKYVVDKAEHAVDSVSAAGDILRNASGPLAAAKVVRNIMKHYNNAKGHTKGRK
jgi:hypothetical protein